MILEGPLFSQVRDITLCQIEYVTDWVCYPSILVSNVIVCVRRNNYHQLHQVCILLNFLKFY